MKTNKNNFRLRTQDIFLTYSQCPLGKKTIYKHIKKLMKKHNITYIIVNEENHRDHKEIHTHVFLQINKMIDIKNPLFFDILDNKKKYHPKMEAAKNIEKCIEYCKKDDKNPIEEGTPYYRPKRLRHNQKEEIHQKIQEFIQELEEKYKTDKKLSSDDVLKQVEDYAKTLNWVVYFEKYEVYTKYIKHTFKLDKKKDFQLIQPKYQLKDFFKCEATHEITLYINEQLKNLGKRPKSIVIIGDTLTGKTQFLLALLNNLNVRFNYIKDNFNFSKKVFSDDVQVNIFDDINMNKIMKYKEGSLIKSIFGGQENYTVDIKYHGLRTIKGGTLNIFLNNEDDSILNYCLAREKKYEESEKEGYKFNYINLNYKYIFDNTIFIKIEGCLYQMTAAEQIKRLGGRQIIYVKSP